ncbi:AMP-binding protein [Ideonella oryzae]|uniref:AMP-binding protein n=1 Tax=Ideonella oryzae TaxID=2937441 RepID=A0ABT1BIU5_9BURK|nr:AMP-binding protein [Ideonella oryzae]MCO5976033.1 AMP-binding protein [Ideonella oryzae]
MPSLLPLLPAHPDDTVVAWHDARPVSRARFLAQIRHLATQLPDVPEVVNLCQSRYWFSLSLLACALRGIRSLLPHALAPESLTGVWAQAPQAPALWDNPPAETSLKPPAVLDVRALMAQPQQAAVPGEPAIPAEQVVARVFTSGSTGRPQSHDKSWGPLCASVQATSERLWSAAGGPCSVVGTVSFRHMYGLESTVLLPLLGGGVLTDEQPFFPADIAASLAQVPGRRLLVSTPFHLRKLLEAQQDLPPLDLLLSATAPLGLPVAQTAESRLGAPLLEIYGATETGQVATRRTTEGTAWRLLAGCELRQDAQGGLTIQGSSQGQPQPVHDLLEITGPDTFELIDRPGNLVNIVGKRSSLSYLNQVLTSLPGVVDGVYCLPPARGSSDDTRLAAFVVAPDQQAGEILHALRAHVDPVFLPRPLVRVEHLPRDANGKITSATVQALIRQHLDGTDAA